MKAYPLKAVATSIIFAISQNVKANETAVASLVEAAKTNFTDVSHIPTLKEDNPILADATSCQLALQLGGKKQLICSWQFDYRDALATNQFIKLNNELRTYSGETFPVIEDLDVNHPDFYDLKTYTKLETSLAVSLKDKAALDQTYVFLRILGALPD